MRLPHLFRAASLLLLLSATHAGAWPIEMGLHGTFGRAASTPGDDGDLESRGSSAVGMRVAMPTRRQHWRQWVAFDSRRERLVHELPLSPGAIPGEIRSVDRTLELHEYSLMIGADRVFGPDSGFRRFVGFGAGYGTGRVTRVTSAWTDIANTTHVLGLLHAGLSFRTGRNTDVEVKVAVLGGNRTTSRSHDDDSPSGLFHREQFSIGLVWPLELPGAR